MDNLLSGPPPTRLPLDPEPAGLLDAGTDPAEVAARFPADSAAWALLAERALAEPGTPAAVSGYAYARTGYHRGLDALRRNGWKGFGPVPLDHPGNAGFLRALAALGRAAGRIGETPEADRIATFLADCDPAATRLLEG
ncbi:MAG TPA: DUF3151 domain-containing protein [Frankiaceae bacterium]|jgi:hypothetical protein